MTVVFSEITGIQQLNEIVSRCSRCPLAGTRGQAVPGEGPVPCDIMLVGEAPGGEEDRQGSPFVGPAGLLLEELLWEAGIDRRAVYITNTVKCRPSVLKNGRTKDRRPSPDELLACSCYLAVQMALVRPRLLIACGAVACRALAWDDVRNLAGKVVVRGRVPTFVMHHPAWGLRDPRGLRALHREMELLREWLAGQPLIRTKAEEYEGRRVVAPAFQGG